MQTETNTNTETGRRTKVSLGGMTDRILKELSKIKELREEDTVGIANVIMKIEEWTYGGEWLGDIVVTTEAKYKRKEFKKIGSLKARCGTIYILRRLYTKEEDMTELQRIREYINNR